MMSEVIRLNQNVTNRTCVSKKFEWLETNGLGGFASGTVAGMHTRRYHGLLVAATQPPVGRMVMLSKFEEALVVNGERIEFSSNEYPGTIHPKGTQYLCEFRLDPYPTFIYQMAGVEIEKRVFMVHGENTTVIEYELRAVDHDPLPECYLELRPLLAYRDYHGTMHRNDSIDGGYRDEGGLLEFRPYEGTPALLLAHSPGAIERTGDWYYNFEYSIERERGLDFREDLFNPVVMRFDLAASPTVSLIASTQARQAGEAKALGLAEARRRARLMDAVPCDDAMVRRLAASADQFLVKRGNGNTIIAGYHWFSDWGRDTMIALPGLTLCTGRFDVARHILETFAESIDQGMLPNRFPDNGEAPEYNTVDATLWYFEAVRAYVAYTGDYAFVRDRLFARLKEILHWHLGGTRYGIAADCDGLLRCGEPGVQLTWMDAKVGDWVVTPRTGKPVEIQALWYNALATMAELAAAFGDRDLEVLASDFAATARRSFHEKFWNDGSSCLYDVVCKNGADGSIRPNQILAVSLHHALLDGERAIQVVDTVRRELLTPMGLRTLAPRDPSYRARYEGGVVERDGAYHQGTVWPWLLGPFLSAYVKVHGGSDDARRQAGEWLAGIAEHMAVAGLGQIPEIADAEFPHTPRGCMAQAWSVAEILRCSLEDIFKSQKNGGITAARERISSAA